MSNNIRTFEIEQSGTAVEIDLDRFLSELDILEKSYWPNDLQDLKDKIIGDMANTELVNEQEAKNDFYSRFWDFRDLAKMQAKLYGGK